MKYRIITIENKAGGREYCTQYKKYFLFGLIKCWQTFIYYPNIQELKDYATRVTVREYCDAVNAIKYHKMFHLDKDIVTIKEIE